MGPKKIVRIIARLNIGGPSIHTILLSSELNKKGYKDILVCGKVNDSEGDMMYLATENDVAPIVIPELGRKISIIKDFKSFIALLSIMKREKPDIVHTHTAKAGTLINEQKATVIVEKLSYDSVGETYDIDIFTQEKPKADFSKAIKVDHHIYDYVFTDSKNERSFVKELDTSAEVVVYAKLPRGFFIPTPVGNYNPDWAIAFQEGTVKHVYFIAETKGSMSSMELREIEKCKIECARKFFTKITSDQVKYDVVDSYGKLMELVK